MLLYFKSAGRSCRAPRRNALRKRSERKDQSNKADAVPAPTAFSAGFNEEVDTVVLQISRILSDQKPHTAGEIAFYLGISSKTVRRKLHFMRDELKWPVEVTRKGFIVRR